MSGGIQFCHDQERQENTTRLKLQSCIIQTKRVVNRLLVSFRDGDPIVSCALPSATKNFPTFAYEGESLSDSNFLFAYKTE